MIRRKRKRGTGLAKLLRRTVAAMAASMGLLGCLVTEDIDFDPPENLPPSIQSTPSAKHPIDGMIVMDLTGPIESSANLPLEVEVHDPNVQQSLIWRTYVGAVSGNGIGEGEIAPSNDITRVPDTISVPRAPLTEPGCHRITLLISGGFVPGERNPRPGNHVAKAVWWVFTKTDSVPRPDPSNCPGAHPAD